jgi:hypothetical protein
MFMFTIFGCLAEETLNVSSETAAVCPAYAGIRRHASATGCPGDPDPVRDGGGAVVHAELGVDTPDVVLDRLLGEEQVRRDLTVGMAARDQRHDLGLACGQAKAGLLINLCAAHETSG